MKNMTRILISFLITLVLLEAGLRLFDPLGLEYFNNLNILGWGLRLDGARGYVLTAGHYSLRGWSATEQDSYTRRLPDNSGGACSLLFVGDSVTWGEGVNDDQTWVDLVARNLPGINIINAAYNGYNSENVRGTIAQFPDAKAIIYLVISNDPFVTSNSGPVEFPPLFATARYLQYFMRSEISPAEDWQRFYLDMDAMNKDGRITFVAFDASFGKSLADKYPVNLIPMYTHWISFIDGHPSIEGNKQIAIAMLPIARKAAEKCNS